MPKSATKKTRAKSKKDKPVATVKKTRISHTSEKTVKTTEHKKQTQPSLRSATAEYPLNVDLPPVPSKFKLSRAYAQALNMVIRKIGPVLLAAASYLVAVFIIGFMTHSFFQQQPLAYLLAAAITFLLSMGLTLYYVQVTQKKQPASSANFRPFGYKILFSLPATFATSLLTLIAFLPFFLLSGILLVFAIANLNLQKIAGLLTQFQTQDAFILLTQSSAHSLSWLIAAGAMLVIGGGVALFASLKYALTLTVIATEEDPSVSTAINYSSYLSQGNKWRLFWLNTFNFILNFFGLLCLGIGLLFTIPLTRIATLSAYHQIKGDA